MFTAMTLEFLTYRELLRQRALAQRAVRLSRNTQMSEGLINWIDSELERRRIRIQERRGANAPVID